VADTIIEAEYLHTSQQHEQKNQENIWLNSPFAIEEFPKVNFREVH
jgi:hypothetical protein